jgi:hypothetical protein
VRTSAAVGESDSPSPRQHNHRAGSRDGRVFIVLLIVLFFVLIFVLLIVLVLIVLVLIAPLPDPPQFPVRLDGFRERLGERGGVSRVHDEVAF